MNQDLMLRLFRSIEGDANDDIVKVADAIIDSERKKGHSKLADRLTGILKRNLQTTNTLKGELKNIFGSTLSIPTDNRRNIPLAVEIPREQLRHEMVLPPGIESKIQRIEKEFVARERLALFGLRPKRRILLHGAPGCGKSMSAERIAWNTGLPFLKVRFEAMISSYLGESASNLIKIFEAIANYPCVLLLDEFDFIAKARGDRQDVGEMHRVVNILLNVLEDFDGPGIVIATTNLQTTIDPALFRRFDDLIELTKPGKAEIINILKNTLGTIKVGSGMNWNLLANDLLDYSAALIVKIALDAAKITVLTGKEEVNMQQIIQSINENKQYKT
ncbi:AAA family ATPase [Sphingobacterium bambusae]|uniref:AAA family ATPase n=1 Tax=Sphingobacterium bambusae TaxID=662858 RepID=A0ABW6BGZ7_9SPHI|nr:ATP-binding protein [Sphingobacterium bambusae]WPL49499.1 ATP-binding protein [Sphingobacterium bambusae]